MTKEEWLEDYFGTPFEELQSALNAAPSYVPPPAPAASPSELPSPPTVEPPGRLVTAMMNYGRNLIPQDFRNITWSDLNQKVELPQTVSTELDPGQNALYMTLPHQQLPFGVNPTSASPRVREFVEAEGQEKWDKGIALGLDVLGSARFLEGGGLPGSVPKPVRKLFDQRAAAQIRGELLPPVSPRTPGYVPAPPPSGQEYLEAFRNAMSKNDEVGAINILQNAGKQDVSIPFRPNDYFSSPSFYVMKELDKYTLQTKGYSPFDTIFRRPPAP